MILPLGVCFKVDTSTNVRRNVNLGEAVQVYGVVPSLQLGDAFKLIGDIPRTRLQVYVSYYP